MKDHRLTEFCNLFSSSSRSTTIAKHSYEGEIVVEYLKWARGDGPRLSD